MPSLLIKDFPPPLHKRLKREAENFRRSMMQQALFILEQALNTTPPLKLPKPFHPSFRLTNKWLERAKREGRA